MKRVSLMLDCEDRLYKYTMRQNFALSEGKRKLNCKKEFIVTLKELLKYFCKYIWIFGIFPFTLKEENLLGEETAFSFSKWKMISLLAFKLEMVILLLVKGIPNIEVDQSLTFVKSLFSSVIVFLLASYGGFLMTLIKAKKIASILDKTIKLEHKYQIKSSTFTKQSLFISLACTLQVSLYVASIIMFFVENQPIHLQILYSIAALHVISSDMVLYHLSVMSVLFLGEAFERVKEDSEISMKEKNLEKLKECRKNHAYVRRIAKEIGYVFMIPMFCSFVIMIVFICALSLILYSQFEINKEYVSSGFLAFQFVFQFLFFYMMYFPYHEATRKGNIKEILITLNMKNKKKNSKDILIELNRFCSEVTANEVRFSLYGIFPMNMANCRENLEYAVTVIIWVIQIGMKDF